MSDNEQTTGYYIERLSKPKLPDVEQLHLAVYGKMPAAADFYARKYDTFFTGVEYVGYIAYNVRTNVPIAYYGVIPCFIAYSNEVVLAAQSADTMTNPKYRLKGLFVELSNLTFQLCRNLGIKLLFGFPNQNSVHGAIHKLGWHLSETMQCFIIKTGGFPLEKIASKHPILKKIYRRYTDGVFKKIEVLQHGMANSLLGEGYGGVLRNEPYLRYKTYTQTRVIQAGRAQVWVKLNNGLIIGDVKMQVSHFNQMMNSLKKMAKKLGVKQIIFQVSPNSQLYGLLLRRYEPVPSFPVLFQDFGAWIPLDQVKFAFADMDIF